MNDPSNTEKILELIGIYLDEVAHAVEALKKSFQHDDILESTKLRRVPRQGKIDSFGTYNFHGIGCWVQHGDIVVDFDFGPDRRCDGFDAWRLHLFAANFPRFACYTELANVEQALGELQRIGLVHAPNWEPSSHLLYLTESGHEALGRLWERIHGGSTP